MTNLHLNATHTAPALSSVTDGLRAAAKRLAQMMSGGFSQISGDPLPARLAYDIGLLDLNPDCCPSGNVDHQANAQAFAMMNLRSL